MTSENRIPSRPSKGTRKVVKLINNNIAHLAALGTIVASGTIYNKVTTINVGITNG
jgi:hypothetical protein